jgi:hypothetical protein
MEKGCYSDCEVVCECVQYGVSAWHTPDFGARPTVHYFSLRRTTILP